MKYNDLVYGKAEIDDPIALKLINSKSLQRLKKIDRRGYRSEYAAAPVGTENPNNRFDHSVGVYLLLRRFGASFKEQIAGLIHDVSHSAFSHCIDYVTNAGSGAKQDHQDTIFGDFVGHSEIPAILDKNGLDYNFLIDDTNFPLKENDLPNLCADRIDYTFRDGLVFGFIQKRAVAELLDALTVDGKRWVFKNLNSAKRFGELLLKMNVDRWANFRAGVMFYCVGEYLKYALEKKYISENDLFLTDGIILKKIAFHHQLDPHLVLLFERMDEKIDCSNNPQNFDATVSLKSRIVDPLCWHNGNVQRLSDLEPNWGRIVKRELSPKQYFLKFER